METTENTNLNPSSTPITNPSTSTNSENIQNSSLTASSQNHNHNNQSSSSSSSDETINSRNLRNNPSRWTNEVGFLPALNYITSQISNDKDPWDILNDLIGSSQTNKIKEQFNTMHNLGNDIENKEIDLMPVWQIILNILTTPPGRKKHRTVTNIDHVVNLIKTSKKIIVVTGAGISVSCGIPDFRSRSGVYAQLKIDYPNLPSPEAMFDINFFKQDPRPFFDFARKLWPGNYLPSITHKFIADLDKNNQLLRNYTQNIDTLEQVAGIQNVIQCHGSFAEATCRLCKKNYKASEIKERIFLKQIPYCNCSDVRYEENTNPTPESLLDRMYQNSNIPIIKPNIVFFGEQLPDKFHNQIEADKTLPDLLIVIGSSMKVRPVSLIPTVVPENCPQILINREPLGQPMDFDVELLGNCDLIIQDLLNRIKNLDNQEKETIIKLTDSLINVEKDENLFYETNIVGELPNKRYIFHGADPMFFKEVERETSEENKDTSFVAD